MLYIDKETKKLVNINYQYKGYSSLNSADIRDKAGVIEIEEDATPDDYVESDYFVTQDWETTSRPYIIYTKKPSEMLDKQKCAKAAQEAQKLLDSTDYLFTLDRNEELVANEPERALELKTKRAEARQVIRKYKTDYPEGI